LAWAAQNYAARIGSARPANYKGIHIVASLTEATAQAYNRMPVHDEQALIAYRAMREETKRQFDLLTRSARRGGQGISVVVQKEDPYDGPLEMMLDVQNGRLKVYATGGPGNEHPFFSDEENDMFRAVHDAFGHAATGRGFDRHGEEAAFRSHASMYLPVARLAMATETRGQNSWFIHNGGQAFPVQKIGLLPWHLLKTRWVGSASEHALAIQQMRRFNLQQFGHSQPAP
jgi:hypothetical protein